MSRLFEGTPFDHPQPCKTCRQLPAQCRCQVLPPKKKTHARPGQLDSGYTLTPENATPPHDQRARIRLEKRKGNRLVTVITGLEHPANDLPKLCSALKTALGAGGAVQGRTIEIQGDHGETVETYLEQRGISARRG